MATNIEIVKELKGTYDMDSPEFYNALDDVLTKHDKLVEICDAQFKDTMFQPYAGANSECFFCGATEGRGRETEHTETCPYLTYKNMV